MKILWFTNTPSLGAIHLNAKGIGGGWIESLEAEIVKSPEIELGIVFKFPNTSVKEFIDGKTTYFPVNNKPAKGKFRKMFDRLSHRIVNEEYIPEYLRIIQQFNPDIIHIFGTESDFGLINYKISIPCIIHIQGNLNVISHKWYSGISLFSLLRYSKKTMLLRGYGLIHDYIVCRKEAERERIIYKACRYFMGRTDWDRRIALVLSPGSSYYHCDELIQMPFHLSKWSFNTSKEYTIFSTIRSNIYKGLETIFESMELINQNFPAQIIRWKIAGIKPEDEIANILERKNKKRFSDINIQFLGSLQTDELISELQLANLFVHPTHADNSPNSLCEAMLLGMPVISTYAGGIPSLIDDKFEGLLIQDGDPFALAGAIMELINDTEYAIKLGANARTRARKRHNPEAITNTVRSIYQAIVIQENTGNVN
ncbi:MAG: glycosyltransferase family 4 protein [Bacteroidetes bacterium]|nr:glycosyltransferase family 4 protein [Bacteroidota bacterium]